jgi:hypothetical protein
VPEGMNTAQTLPHSGLLDRDADSISTIRRMRSVAREEIIDRYS